MLILFVLFLFVPFNSSLTVLFLQLRPLGLLLVGLGAGYGCDGCCTPLEVCKDRCTILSFSVSVQLSTTLIPPSSNSSDI